MWLVTQYQTGKGSTLLFCVVYNIKGASPLYGLNLLVFVGEERRDRISEKTDKNQTHGG